MIQTSLVAVLEIQRLTTEITEATENISVCSVISVVTSHIFSHGGQPPRPWSEMTT